jgi:hypothetical protein
MLTVSLADLALAGFGHMPACRRSTGTCRFQAVTGNEATFLAGVLSAPYLDEVDYCANCEVSATPTSMPAACPDCACARQACCDPQTATCSDEQPDQCAAVLGGAPVGFGSSCLASPCLLPPTHAPTSAPTPTRTVDYCACAQARFVATPSATASLSCASAFDAQTPPLQTLIYSNMQLAGGGEPACFYEGVAQPNPLSLNDASAQLDVCGSTLVVTWTTAPHPLCGTPGEAVDSVDTFKMVVEVRRADMPVLIYKPHNTTMTCTDAARAANPLHAHQPPPLVYTNMESVQGCQISGTIDTVAALTRVQLNECGGTGSFLEFTWSGVTGHICDAASPLTHTQRVFSHAAPRGTFDAAYAALPRGTLTCVEAAIFNTVPLAYSNAVSLSGGGGGGSGLCTMSGEALGQVTHVPSTCGGTQTEQWRVQDACGRVLEASLVRLVDSAPVATFVSTHSPTPLPAALPLPGNITLSCAAFIDGTYTAPVLVYSNGLVPVQPAPEHCAIGGFAHAERYFYGGGGGGSGGGGGLIGAPPRYACDICGTAFTEEWRHNDACGRLIVHSRVVSVNASHGTSCPASTCPSTEHALVCGPSKDERCAGHGVTLREKGTKKEKRKKTRNKKKKESDNGGESPEVPEGAVAVCVVRKELKRGHTESVTPSKRETLLKRYPLSYNGSCRRLCKCELGYAELRWCAECDSHANGGLSEHQVAVCRPLRPDEPVGTTTAYARLLVCVDANDEHDDAVDCEGSRADGDMAPSFNGSTGVDCACRPMRGACYVHAKTCVVTSQMECEATPGGVYQRNYTECPRCSSELLFSTSDNAGESATPDDTHTSAHDGSASQADVDRERGAVFRQGKRRGVLYASLFALGALVLLSLMLVSLFASRAYYRRRRSRDAVGDDETRRNQQHKRRTKKNNNHKYWTLIESLSGNGQSSSARELSAFGYRNRSGTPASAATPSKHGFGNYLSSGGGDGSGVDIEVSEASPVIPAKVSGSATLHRKKHRT